MPKRTSERHQILPFAGSLWHKRDGVANPRTWSSTSRWTSLCIEYWPARLELELELVWMLNDKSSHRSYQLSVTINSRQFLVFISQAGGGRQSSERRQAGNRSLYHSPQITGEINDQSWPGCSQPGEWSRTEDDQWKSLNKSTDKRLAAQQWWYFGLFVDCGYLRVRSLLHYIALLLLSPSTTNQSDDVRDSFSSS